MKTRSIFKNKLYFDAYIQTLLKCGVDFDERLRNGKIPPNKEAWAYTLHRGALLKLLMLKQSYMNSVTEYLLKYEESKP